MSDEAKFKASVWGVAGAVCAIITATILIASRLIGLGEIIHEIKGLRSDVSELKEEVKAERKATREAISEVIREHRQLEKRVEVLEVHDAQHFN